MAEPLEQYVFQISISVAHIKLEYKLSFHVVCEQFNTSLLDVNILQVTNTWEKVNNTVAWTQCPVSDERNLFWVYTAAKKNKNYSFLI